MGKRARIRKREREAGKSEWLGSGDSSAYDPVTDDEKNALGLLGASSLRDGAIGGASDPAREGSVAPHERATEGETRGPRENPELLEQAGTGDGGISASGGVAGGVGASPDDSHSIVRGRIGIPEDYRKTPGKHGPPEV